MNIKINLSICLLAVAALIVLINITKSSTNQDLAIGIIQTASHPALDAARQGFVDEIKKTMGNSVTIIVNNAQGSIANSHMIATRYAKDPAIKLIYAIATPAAQAMAAIEKNKPIVIAAVTDPSIVGSQHNVGGVTDIVDMTKQIEMMMLLTPSIKTVGILYSTGEPNSLKQLALMKEHLAKRTITIVEVGITHESDLPLAAATACRKADALLCPTDNTIASGMHIIAKIARDYNKPLYACHNQAVEQGALAARGVDYTLCGAQAGAIAHACITAKNTDAIPLINADSHTTIINITTLRHLGLTIPESLINYHMAL